MRYDQHRTLGTRTDRSAGLSIGDVDGDGALDIVVGNSGQKNAVFFTTGKGTLLQETQFGLPENLTYGVAVADLNGDGYLDIAVANSGAYNVAYFGRPGEDWCIANLKYAGRPRAGSLTLAVLIGRILRICSETVRERPDCNPWNQRWRYTN